MRTLWASDLKGSRSCWNVPSFSCEDIVQHTQDIRSVLELQASDGRGNLYRRVEQQRGEERRGPRAGLEGALRPGGHDRAGVEEHFDAGAVLSHAEAGNGARVLRAPME